VTSQTTGLTIRGLLLVTHHERPVLVKVIRFVVCDEAVRVVELGRPDEGREVGTSTSEITVKLKKCVGGRDTVGLLRVSDGSEISSSSPFQNKQYTKVATTSRLQTSRVTAAYKQ